jgi:hypothetical protein
MAIITQDTVAGVNGPVTLTTTTLGASDTLTYTSGSSQYLELDNTTGGNLTVTITGSTAGNIYPDGYGDPVDLSAGYAITVNAGVKKIVKLDRIAAWLSGIVTLTGASGLKARLFTA